VCKQGFNSDVAFENKQRSAMSSKLLQISFRGEGNGQDHVNTHIVHGFSRLMNAGPSRPWRAASAGQPRQSCQGSPASGRATVNGQLSGAEVDGQKI
jgi:hypothetical protein